jgi:tetratricopeptide (TPR) repeat protein
MIETGLVYLHRPGQANGFVGCGALIENELIATCRHVWRLAVGDSPSEDAAAEVEFPRAWENGATVRTTATLVDACDDAPDGPVPDLVLLRPKAIPSGVMTLPLAFDRALEVGEGYVHARLCRPAANGGNHWFDDFPEGRIGDRPNAEGLRRFAGTEPQGYWFVRGSSGSPAFLRNGQQLAGILSLSELGAMQAGQPIRMAFLVPGTTIRAHAARLAARPVAAAAHVSLADLAPILSSIGAENVPLAEVPARLHAYVEQARALAAAPAPATNNGTDIEAVIGAARDHLGRLDSAGARAVLQAKIAEEEQARARRLLPLLRERLSVEQLDLDHAAAIATLGEISRLDPDDVRAWIELGDLRRLTGSLSEAARAYRAAEAAARLIGDERELSISHIKIGDVLFAEGDHAGALTAFRTGLALAEVLARRSPDNTEWQRDLSICHERIGDVLRVEGDHVGALTAYRAVLVLNPISLHHIQRP